MEQSNQDAGIKMVVGLGNPGPDYANTRHNAGAWLVERFVFEQRAVLAEDKRFMGQFAKVRVGSNDVFVLLPSTYMNRSGQAVNALARFYKLLPQHVLVVHDELDLLPGQVRLKQGGGSAGHNGVKDITAHLGTPNFWRLRIGIGHPRTLGLNQQVSDFVLHRPSAQHQGAIDEAIARGLKHLNGCFTGGFQNVITAMHTAVDVK